MKRSHPSLIALRMAAVEWAKASVTIPTTPGDEAFRKVDRKLRRAAERYVRAKERGAFTGEVKL